MLHRVYWMLHPLKGDASGSESGQIRPHHAHLEDRRAFSGYPLSNRQPSRSTVPHTLQPTGRVKAPFGEVPKKPSRLQAFCPPARQYTFRQCPLLVLHAHRAVRAGPGRRTPGGSTAPAGRLRRAGAAPLGGAALESRHFLPAQTRSAAHLLQSGVRGTPPPAPPRRHRRRPAIKWTRAVLGAHSSGGSLLRSHRNGHSTLTGE